MRSPSERREEERRGRGKGTEGDVREAVKGDRVREIAIEGRARARVSAVDARNARMSKKSAAAREGSEGRERVYKEKRGSTANDRENASKSYRRTPAVDRSRRARTRCHRMIAKLAIVR